MFLLILYFCDTAAQPAE